MKNCSMNVKDGKLVITIDLSQDFGISKSGKSVVIGSTEGNQSVIVNNQMIKVGVNVYKQATDSAIVINE